MPKEATCHWLHFVSVAIFMTMASSCSRNQTASDAYNKGFAHAQRGEYDQAIIDFTEAIRLAPKYAAAYYSRGNLYFTKGQYDQSIADFTEAIRLAPKNADAYCNRGNVYAEMGESDRAIADCTEAIRLNPKHAGTYNNRGRAYAQKGNCDEAIANFTKAIQLDPENGQAYYNRGLAYAQISEYDRAITDHIKAAEIQPRGKFKDVIPRRPRQLGFPKGEKQLEDWLKQLKSPRTAERAEAARELGYRATPGSHQVGDVKPIVSGLMDAVKDANPSVRLDASYALARTDSAAKKATGALLEASKDSEGRVRVAARLALWSITKDESSFSKLLEYLKHESPVIRRDAVGALLFASDAFEAAKIHGRAGWVPTYAHNKTTVAALIPAIKDQDHRVRRLALFALAIACWRGEAKEAVPVFVEEMRDQDPNVRRGAASALAGIGSEAKAAVPAFIEALKDKEVDVRRTTAWAFGRIASGDKAAVSALAAALRDDDSEVRWQAAYSLGRIGPEASSAVAPLNEASEDRSVDVRVAARLALWRVTGDENLVHLAVADAAEAQEESAALLNAAGWLGSIGAPAVPLLLEILKHPQGKVRNLAATALAFVDSPPKEAVAALKESLQDSDPEVRESAARALRVIDPEAAKSAKAGEVGRAQPQDESDPAAGGNHTTGSKQKRDGER